jgi:hypothetical protein
LLAGVLFLASPRKSSQKEGDPKGGAGFAGSLRYSERRAAAELGALPLKQSSPTAPGLPALLSAFHGDPKSVHGQPPCRKNRLLRSTGKNGKKLKSDI